MSANELIVSNFPAILELDHWKVGSPNVLPQRLEDLVRERLWVHCCIVGSSISHQELMFFMMPLTSPIQGAGYLRDVRHQMRVGFLAGILVLEESGV